MTYYIVLDIRSGHEIKRTASCGTAAQWLNPGTVYGAGETTEDARRRAEKQRAWHLANGY